MAPPLEWAWDEAWFAADVLRSPKHDTKRLTDRTGTARQATLSAQARIADQLVARRITMTPRGSRRPGAAR